MDAYEYLLNKLNAMLEFIPEFNTYSLYLKLETGEKIITNLIPMSWTHERIFKYYRNLDLNEFESNGFLREYNKETDRFCRQLRQFPNDLNSIEHVDLLLTLHGINKGA